MRKSLLLLLILFIFLNCSTDEVDSMIDEQEETEQENTNPSVLFTAAITSNDLDNETRKRYYFITDENNVLIGNYISFNQVASAVEILSPEGFNDSSYTLHSLTIEDKSADTNNEENYHVSLSSFLNISAFTRYFPNTPNTESICSDNNSVLNTNFTFNNLPNYNWGTFTSQCASGGYIYDSVFPPNFENSLPLEISTQTRSAFFFMRDDDTGYYSYFDNLENGDEFIVDGSDLSTDMTLFDPEYTLQPDFLNVVRVKPEGIKAPSGFVYRYSEGTNLPNYFLPNFDSTTLYRAEATFRESSSVDGVTLETATVYKSRYYHTVNQSPDLLNMTNSLDLVENGNFLDWQFNFSGDFDISISNVYSRDAILTGTEGAPIDLNRFVHSIYSNQENTTYIFPTIPEDILALYPMINADFINNNDLLQREMTVVDVEDINSYQEYIEALFAKNSISSRITIDNVNTKNIVKTFF